MHYFILFLALTVSAQVRFYKIQKTSLNGAIITYKNFGTNDTDVSNYFIGSNNKYTPIYSNSDNTIKISGTGPIIPPGETWTIDYTPWVNNVGNPEGYDRLSPSTDISLRKNFGYISSENIIDFVQYCDATQKTPCVDFGEHWRAASIGFWDSYNVEDRHINYVGTPVVMSFKGDSNDRGRRFWSTTSNPVSNNILCQNIETQIVDLLIKILDLKKSLGC